MSSEVARKLQAWFPPHGIPPGGTVEHDDFRRTALAFGPDAIPHLLEILGGVYPNKIECALYLLGLLGCEVEVIGEDLEALYRVRCPGDRDWIEIRRGGRSKLAPIEVAARLFAETFSTVGERVKERVSSGYVVQIGAAGDDLGVVGVYCPVVDGEMVDCVELLLQLAANEDGIECRLFFGHHPMEKLCTIRLPATPAEAWLAALEQLKERVNAQEKAIVEAISAPRESTV